MLDLAKKGGLEPYPMLDNVIQSEVVDVAGKQLVAAFARHDYAGEGARQHGVRAEERAGRAQGLDLQVGIRCGARRPAGATRLLLWQHTHALTAAV